MTRSTRRTLVALLAAVLTTGPFLVIPTAAAPRSAAGAPSSVPAGGEWQLRVTGISPAVVTDDGDVTVTGTITNAGSSTASAPEITLAGAATTLVGRAAIRGWAHGDGTGPTTSLLDQHAPVADLAPGGSAKFTLTATAPVAGLDDPFGVLPIAVSGGGSSVATFIPFATRLEYEPLRVAILTPLTLPADAALAQEYGEGRAAAWSGQLGDDGRLRRLISATAGLPVTWAIDPTLLAPPAAIPAARPTEAEAGAAWDRIGTDQRTETSVRRRFAAILRSRLPGRDSLLLPYADPDLTPMLAVPALTPHFAPLLERAVSLAANLPGTARTDLAWPADGRLGRDRVAALAGLYGDGLTTVLGSAASLPGANTPQAAQAAVDGVRVLAYDDGLSNALLGLTGDPDGVLTGQLLLADSLGILGEFPGTPRDVLVAVPRSVEPGQGALLEALTRLTEAAWITTGSVADLEAVGDGDPVPETAAEELTLPEGVTPDPGAGPVALTAGRFRTAESALAAISALAPVRIDGAESEAFWAETMRQVTSARWRTDRQALVDVIRAMTAAGDRSRSGLAVSGETINFFAESGLLSVTVTNDLDVAVRDVRVEVTPLARRIRITQAPEPIDIGANSRATVRFPATALAAGTVPLRVVLRAPDGAPVGTGNTVMVRAFPTGSWVYWVIGVFAAGLLAAGIIRSRRRKARA